MLFLPPKAAVIISTSVAAAAVAVMGTMLLKTHHDHDHNLHLSSSPPQLLRFFLHSSSDALSSWLTPTFLYLLVNAIIISILASSKLQQYSKTAASSSPADDVSLSGYGGFSETEVSRNSGLEEGGQLEEPPVDGQKATEREEDHAPASSVVPHGGWDDLRRRDMAAAAADDEYSGGGGLTREEDREAKPPVSSRFVPRKSALPPPPNGSATSFTHRSKGCGGSKAAAAGLGISKSGRRDETLESTWKMITEGRRVPLTRHLKKSDTWNTGHVAVPSAAAGKVMKKSETFRDAGKSGGRKNEMGATTSDMVGRAAKKREPSLGQEELNRRVEAFIKNFNEEMRLQRQESLNRYRELLRAGGVVSV